MLNFTETLIAAKHRGCGTRYLLPGRRRGGAGVRCPLRTPRSGGDREGKARNAGLQHRFAEESVHASRAGKARRAISFLHFSLVFLLRFMLQFLACSITLGTGVCGVGGRGSTSLMGRTRWISIASTDTAVESGWARIVRPCLRNFARRTRVDDNF